MLQFGQCLCPVCESSFLVVTFFFQIIKHFLQFVVFLRCYQLFLLYFIYVLEPKKIIKMIVYVCSKKSFLRKIKLYITFKKVKRKETMLDILSLFCIHLLSKIGKTIKLFLRVKQVTSSVLNHYDMYVNLDLLCPSPLQSLRMSERFTIKYLKSVL